MNVLWYRPDKPEDVSVGRHRIAAILRERGHHVVVRNVTGSDFRSVLRNRPDVVMGTTRLGAFVGAWKRLLHGTPLVVDHIDPIDQLGREHNRATVTGVAVGEALAFRLASHVMVVYERELPRVRRHSNAVTHTRLGVDFDRFANPNETVIDRVTNKLDGLVDDDAKLVTYIGGLEPEYNLDVAVEAMDHLDGWQLLILGDGSDRTLVERAAAKRGTVVYPGTVPHEEMPGFLAAADVGICLLDDPNTLKLLEYAAAGLPAVNLDGAARDRFGDLVEYCSLDPEDVARAVRTAAADAPIEAFRTFAADHSWDTIATEYERVLTAAAR
jgi:glycosyltransferase involved in cell wall biosynthesis